MNRSQAFFSNRRHTRRILSLTAFIGALTAYLLTLEPDASYWDCPEYLVTALRLEIGHPPGNPVWTLASRVISLLGQGDPNAAAIIVNASSALFTALAVAMLASCIFIMLTLTGFPTRRRDARANILRALPALGGSLCFAWADSPWFSAVESEVYAMSLFLTALCMRLMLGWAMMPRGNNAARRLMLIVYLTGLSIGVHQLNLLVIPALALIWLFRRRIRPAGIARIAAVILISFAAVGLILLAMMPGVIEAASKMELVAVNSFGFPPHSGVWIFWGGALFLTWGLPLILTRAPRRWQMIAWIPAMLLTGYSSYMILLVRSAAEPPMNEGAPVNILSLAGYLGRDQYGSTPLFYGRTPMSGSLRLERIGDDCIPDYSRIATKEGRAMYASTDSGYVLYEHVRRPIYQPELNMFLPRLTSSNPADIESYADWAGMTQRTMIPVEVSFALDSTGNPVGRLGSDGQRIRETELRPTYIQQLRYLLTYQIGYMYCRYMLWNFSGRQNDRFAVGEIDQGNFLTGIPPLDDAMLGPQSAMPEEIGKDNPGHNVYFMLPLLTGILGIFMLQSRGRRGRRANLVILMLFLMTGLAIVFYINQSPREPRERDYSFLGSMWAYCIWIAAGMAWMIGASLKLRYSRRKALRRLAPWFTGAASLFSILLPAWMLCQNYDDHDRSGRHGVSDFATNFLESLEPNAIVFTNGDNFTFPLWWAQEALGVRPDVTIINTAYLGTHWYISQLRMENAGAPGLLMNMPADSLKFGVFKYTPYIKTSATPTATDSLGAVDAIRALRELYAEGERHPLPGMLRIFNPENGDSLTVRTSAVASGAGNISLRNLAILDIIASNAVSPEPRPVYWHSSLSGSDFGGMFPFTSRTLHTRRLVYSDTITPVTRSALLDVDMEKARRMLSGRTPGRGDGHIYADDTFGKMMTCQRLGLLRLGGRLLREGRYEEALETARIIERLFPSHIWEYQIYTEADSSCNEGLDHARLYLDASYYLHPGLKRSENADYMHGYKILERERERHMQWRRYRQSLSPGQRKVMSPKAVRKARVIPSIADSLYRHYSPARR